MQDFRPSFERPCPLSATFDADDEAVLWARWEAGFDAARAARQGPPSPVRVENARRLAEAERILFGRVVTR